MMTLSRMKCFALLMALGAMLVSMSLESKAADVPKVVEADVVIYGATSGGIAAAVQVKRMGHSVVILEPGTHLGGLTAGGLGWTDTGDKSVIGGISRQFYQDVKKHYDDPKAWPFQEREKYKYYRADDDAMWVFEPKVATAIYQRWVKDNDIPVHFEQRLDRSGKKVVKEGTRITQMTMESGLVAKGKVFMDCTYEGDLLAESGVEYFLGREPNSQYGETINGLQAAKAKHHQFTLPVSAYRIPNDPKSGLLPYIGGTEPTVPDGTGDKRMQAYCYRMCLSSAPENRLPIPKPANYDPVNYELLARNLEAGWDEVFRKFDPAPNNKTDTNNHGGFSFDFIGMNYGYPEADYATREALNDQHRDYQLGLLWFLQNDPRVPEKIQSKAKMWGLPKDEFVDNGGWPHQLYIREARRMVGVDVVTENHVTQKVKTDDSIGMGSYNIDSHNTQRYVTKEGLVRNEGDVQIHPGGPYPITLKSILPKENQATNLLVPVCLSASHVAYGSIRMEPVFMILGQSAGTVAVLSIDGDKPVQKVAYDEVKPILVKDGQVLYREKKVK
jgi:hypothetical protein